MIFVCKMTTEIISITSKGTYEAVHRRANGRNYKIMCSTTIRTSEIATFDESTQLEVLNLTMRLATCPVKLIFRIATVGSLSRNGGIIQKYQEIALPGAYVLR
jgi:hypothetical protein